LDTSLLFVIMYAIFKSLSLIFIDWISFIDFRKYIKIVLVVNLDTVS
jgi:hypothetical protein